MSDPPEILSTATVASAGLAAPALVGTVLLLIQFDVCEEIHVERLATALGVRTAAATSSTPSTVASKVRYERPPVIEPVHDVILPNEGRFSGEIKYYDYGVLSVVLHIPFSGNWNELIRLASRWVWDIDLAAQAERLARGKMARAGPFMVKPYARYLSEDYLIFHVREISGVTRADQVLSHYSAPIAQVVRGDNGDLAESEISEVVRSSISYYTTDLAIIGWNAAFLYDTSTGAETAIQLLEYANSQLLEFRHYDELLTSELGEVYAQLETKLGPLGGWRLARSATRLQATLLEVNELTEHADNAIKFLSDMFSARLYRLCAARVGVPDYRNLVTSKVHVAEELYRFMVDQYHQSRGFFLDLVVVIILVIELVFLFRGKVA